MPDTRIVRQHSLEVDGGFIGVFVAAAIVTGGCGVAGEVMSEIKVK